MENNLKKLCLIFTDMIELDIVLHNKHEAVRKQDFEEASKLRGMENELRSKLPSIEEVRELRRKIESDAE